MPIFNISYFNATNEFRKLNGFPIPSTYSNVKIFGQGIFDTIWAEDYIRTNEQIESLNIFAEPEWDANTIMLAKFNNNLQAGSVTSLPSPVDNWGVFRKGKNESKFTRIGDMLAEDLIFTDRLALSKEIYEYEIIPKSGDILGEPLLADKATTDFDKVILLDPIINEGYSLCYNIQLSDTTIEEDVTVSDTRGRYQTTLRGNKQVAVGNITVIATGATDISNGVQQDVEFLNSFKEFILNGREKILKFTDGIAYRVTTSEYSMIKLDGLDSAGNIVYNISFSWRECGVI